VQLEDLVAGIVFAEGILAEYAKLNVPAPEWIAEKSRELRSSAVAKVEEQRALELRNIERELDGLKTKEERKNELLARKAALEGKTPVSA